MSLKDPAVNPLFSNVQIRPASQYPKRLVGAMVGDTVGANVRESDTVATAIPMITNTTMNPRIVKPRMMNMVRRRIQQHIGGGGPVYL